MTAARVRPLHAGADTVGIELADPDLQTNGKIGIGIPADRERQVHVFAHVKLRRYRAESMTETEGDVAVALVERERARWPIRRGASIDLQIDRAVLAQREFRTGREPVRPGPEGQIPDADLIE